MHGTFCILPYIKYVSLWISIAENRNCFVSFVEVSHSELQYLWNVGFEVLKSSVFWDITPRSLLKVNRRFEVTCRLHFQGRKIGEARKQHEAGRKSSSASSTLKIEATCSSGTAVAFNGLPRVISQKIGPFICKIVYVVKGKVSLWFYYGWNQNCSKTFWWNLSYRIWTKISEHFIEKFNNGLI
jgi:hypothetical protein